MNRTWLIRFTGVGAGLATAGVCLWLIGSPDREPPASTEGDAAGSSVDPRNIAPVDPPAPVWQVERDPDDPSNLRLEVVTPLLRVEPVEGGAVLRLDGQAGPMPRGVPDLPVLARLDAGRPGLRARVKVLDAVYRDVPGVTVAPTEALYQHWEPGGEPELVPARTPDPAIYGQDAFWPPVLAEVEEAWQGTNKWVRTAVHPVQYNPVTGTVRYYETLSIALEFEPEEEPVTEDAAPLLEKEEMAVAASDPFDAPPLYGDPVLPPMNGDPDDFAVRRAGAECDAIYKIEVTEDGIYKVTQPELAAAGMQPSEIVGADLRLFCRDREAAIHTSTSGLMGTNDYFLFYGEGYEGWYTDRNVYWLGLGEGGLRMAEQDGSEQPGAPVIDTHYAWVRYAKNSFFSAGSSPLNEDWDHWVAIQLLTIGGSISTSLTHTMTLHDPVAGLDAKVAVSLHGISQVPGVDPGHNTTIQFNGATTERVTFSWSGITEFEGAPYQGSATFSSSALLDGPNTMYAWQRAVGAAINDQVYVETIDLIYPRRTTALGNLLHFQGEPGTNTYFVDGFTSPSNLRLFEITDPWAPSEVMLPSPFATNGGYGVRFSLASAAHPAFVLKDSALFRTVESIEKSVLRGLSETGQQADYIVICPQGYREQVYRLITNRYVKGQSVAVATIDDVYNEFSYGIKDVAAVRQFLGFAFHHWNGPPPSHVLLVGDGTDDPRGYVGPSSYEVLPVRFGGTPYTYAAMDPWFTLVNGDDILCDMVIGRIPVISPAGLAAVVDKIIAYEALEPTAAFRTRGLLVQDQGLNFDVPADEVFDIMTSNAFTSINRQIAGAGGSKSGVLSALNTSPGRFAAAYFGHGSSTRWDNPAMLETTDVLSLTNTGLPIVTATTCINGYFVNRKIDPPNGQQEGLAEALVERSGRGAIAAIAGTALSQEAAANELAVFFFDAVLNERHERLGDAMADAYLQTWGVFSTAPELILYQIFGDPGLIINP